MKHGRNSKQKQVAISGADDKQIDAIVMDDGRQTDLIISPNYFSGGQVDTEPLRQFLLVYNLEI